ncbi:MAG: AI-2E family transporter [Polyangiaceae bacterium]|nr:AI-2E family transporter [Polyangiaceae bacterium]
MTPSDKYARLYATRFVFRRVGWLAAAAGAVAIAYLLRGVLVPLFLSFLLAYALDPPVDRLTRWKVPRSLSAVLVMLAISAVVVLVAVVAVPYFIDQFSEAASELPGQVQRLRARAEPWLLDTFKVGVPHSWSDLQQSYGASLKERAPQLFQGAIPALFGTFNFVVVAAGSLIIPVFALYLLTDFDMIVERAEVLVPRRFAKTTVSVAREVHTTLGKYVRGQVLASLCLALVYAVGLKIVGVRLAIPIGVLTGLLAFVPYVGFSVGLSMAIVMSVLDWQGPGTLVGVLIVMFGGQVLDGFLITPRIVGGSVGLRPIEVLLTMMAAGTLFGFLGVLLAVPLGAVVKILVSRATEAYLSSHYYKTIPPTPTPTPFPLATPLPLGRGAPSSRRAGGKAGDAAPAGASSSEPVASTSTPEPSESPATSTPHST